jgi:hypothetical protein
MDFDIDSAEMELFNATIPAGIPRTMIFPEGVFACDGRGNVEVFGFDGEGNLYDLDPIEQAARRGILARRHHFY